MPPCLVSFRWFLKILVPNRPGATIRREVLTIQHTIILELYLTTTSCNLFIVLVVDFGASKAVRTCLIGRRGTSWYEYSMKSSSKFMLSYHSCSSAYELEYSCPNVIITIYELAYSFCVMILACSTLSLTIHMTCMSRSRTGLGWWFVVPLGLPISFTYRFVGLGTRRGIGSFFVHGRGAQVHGNLRI
jgi:hypothetical protein